MATLRGVMGGGLLPQSDGSAPRLDKRFQYLRVQYNQQPAVYMALGFVDIRSGHAVQTWYSADGEVIQLIDGRITGTTGLPFDWANVQLSKLPSFDELADGRPLTYSRHRDNKAGYAYNLTDTIQAIRKGANAISQLPDNTPPLPSNIWWVEETTAALPAAVVAVLPTANGSTWVYSYQCLSLIHI